MFGLNRFFVIMAPYEDCLSNLSRIDIWQLKVPLKERPLKRFVIMWDNALNLVYSFWQALGQIYSSFWLIQRKKIYSFFWLTNWDSCLVLWGSHSVDVAVCPHEGVGLLCVVNGAHLFSLLFLFLLVTYLFMIFQCACLRDFGYLWQILATAEEGDVRMK